MTNKTSIGGASIGESNVTNGTSYAVGYGNTTKDDSTAVGHFLTTDEKQTVVGRYNEPNPDAAYIFASGESKTDRKNLHTIDRDGNAWFAGKITTGEDNTSPATLYKLYFDGSDIYTNYEAWAEGTDPLGFDDIYEMCYDRANFVYIGDGQMKYYPQLDLDIPNKPESITFMSSAQLDGRNLHTRIIITEDNLVKTDQIIDAPMSEVAKKVTKMRKVFDLTVSDEHKLRYIGLGEMKNVTKAFVSIRASQAYAQSLSIVLNGISNSYANSEALNSVDFTVNIIDADIGVATAEAILAKANLGYKRIDTIMGEQGSPAWFSVYRSGSENAFPNGTRVLMYTDAEEYAVYDYYVE